MDEIAPTDDPVTLTGLLARAAARWPERVAWRFDPGETLTYAEVAERVSTYAGALADRGVRPGDRVALMLRNETGFALTWFALVRLGAVVVPLNVRYRSADAGHVLERARVRLAVTTPDLAPVLAPSGVTVVDVADLTAATRPGPAAVAAEPGDTVGVQFTSGTTGRPKGCVLSHAYWLTLATGMREEHPRLAVDDVLLTAQPFSYVDPQWNVVAAMLVGAELVVLDGFHPSTFWERVRHHRVTYFYCLAAMPTLLLRTPADPHDRDHRVRVVQCSAIPPRLHAALEERWGVPWFETFGMTETGADLRVREADHDALVGSGCVGSPTSYREVAIAGDGPTGELLLRGPGMMDGYLDDPDATAATLRDGWMHTGDLARLDEEGRVHLVGRLKDMIRRSGENVAAREVEDVLGSHPAVRLVAVVGVPDELRGEEVRAYVVVDPTSEPGPALATELAAWCAERLARFKVPRYVSFHDDLPRTPSERVEKARLATDPGLASAAVTDLAADRQTGRGDLAGAGT